jgi:hypothetical protein
VGSIFGGGVKHFRHVNIFLYFSHALAPYQGRRPRYVTRIAEFGRGAAGAKRSIAAGTTVRKDERECLG